MSDLERRCQTAFVESGLPISFLEYYGSTGNVAILASGVPASGIRSALFRAVPVSQRTGARLGGMWTARSFDVLQNLLDHAGWKLAVR